MGVDGCALPETDIIVVCCMRKAELRTKHSSLNAMQHIHHSHRHDKKDIPTSSSMLRGFVHPLRIHAMCWCCLASSVRCSFSTHHSNVTLNMCCQHACTNTHMLHTHRRWSRGCHFNRHLFQTSTADHAHIHIQHPCWLLKLHTQCWPWPARFMHTACQHPHTHLPIHTP